MTPGPGIARTPLPEGFRAGGICCGVRRYRPDLGVIVSDRDAVGAAVFTVNAYKAAPVLFSKELVPSRHVRAIITNSGQANAATGEKGRENNWKMASSVAQWVGCRPHQILTASTGVIGQQMEIDKIVAAVPALIERAAGLAEPFALAILTTDLVPKTVTTTVALSKGEVRITGICKGSGMIHPNMATMLGYLLTDADVPLELSKPLLTEANRLSFNRISVDGETSTNDCVFFLANGASGVPVAATPEDLAKFQAALVDVAKVLAKAIARDGEGADKLIEVTVRGAPNEEMAERAARGITLSPLIKAAVHGADPNWGRILARLGADKVPEECLDRMVLSLQGTALFSDGTPAEFDRMGLRIKLKTDTVSIDVDLKSGTDQATAWGCDLTQRYVEINTEYN